MTSRAFAEGHRGALLIGTGSYDHPQLPTLLSPAVDCQRLAEVLSDKEIGGFDVQQLVDADQATLTRAMGEFFGPQARHDDVRLLYLSCHGIRSHRQDRLHFAVRTTDPDLPAATSISASFVRDLMDECWARSIVVLLDCCYSGMFLPGAKGHEDSATLETALAGHGRVVITAGSAAQRVWEGEHSDPASPAPSRFTGALIDGLRTGAADRDKDGLVGVRELYEYVYERLQRDGVGQTPRMGGETQYDIALARVKPKPKPKKKRPKRALKPAPPASRTDLPWRVRAAIGRAHQPLLSDGMAIVHEQYRLHVIDPETRSRRLSIELRHRGKPVLHDGTIYAPDQKGRLQAATLQTGRFRPFSPLTVCDGLLGVSGDVLYAPSLDGHLYAIDLLTGKPLWPAPVLLGAPVMRPPEIVGRNVIILTEDPARHVVAVDAATGREVWTHQAEGAPTAEWAVSERRVHLVQPAGTTTGRVVTLDSDGQAAWTRELQAVPVTAPWASDGMFVFGDTERRLIALEADTGNAAWPVSKRTQGRLLTRPTVVGDILYTADRAACLTAWRLRDGRRLSSQDLLLSEDSRGCPAGAGDVLYVTDSRGDLHALPTR
ncbi:Outer membrane protein assembly factor BamB [Streptomyces sp. enrichment culture]|uniref:caspase, EACC1-associated type n=1 Tax=Streptomyces sp. enrichment culture TaxID=1795815 RepID=UPI003F5574CE